VPAPRPTYVEYVPLDDFSFQDPNAELTQFQKRAGELPARVTKYIDLASVPVATAVGYAFVPTAKVPIKLIGGGLGGYLANEGRKRLLEERFKAAPVAVASLLDAKGFENVDVEEVMEIKKDYQANQAEWDQLTIDIYKKFFVNMVKNGKAQTAEIKQLRQLYETLGMQGEAIAEAHYQSCVQIYNEVSDSERGIMNKCLFLTDRIFQESDTEEAYIFEMSRVRNLFGLDDEGLFERFREVYKPFYQQALNQVPSRIKTITRDALKRARDTLGVDAKTQFDMHVAFFEDELLRLLNRDDEVNMEPEDYDYLEKLSKLLRLRPETVAGIFEICIAPVYEVQNAKYYSEAFELATEEDRRQHIQKMARLRQMLRIPNAHQKHMIRTLTEETMAGCWSIVLDEHLALNSAGVLFAMEKLMSAARICYEMSIDLVGIPTSEDGEKLDPIDEYFYGVLFDKEKTFDHNQVYKTFVDDILKDKRLTDEQEWEVKVLEAMLCLDHREVVETRVKSGVEIVKEKLLEVATENRFTEEAKAEVTKILEEMKVPVQSIPIMGKQLYKKRLTDYTAGNSIITREANKVLDQMGRFFDLDKDMLQQLDNNAGKPVYEKIVSDAMGPTGILPEEFIPTLDKLAERMRLSPPAAKKAYFDAASKRVRPLVESMVYTYEMSTLSREKLAQRYKTDYGSDVGIKAEGVLGMEAEGNVMADALTLVDFFDENKLTEEAVHEWECPVTGEMKSKKIFKFPFTVEELVEESTRDSMVKHFLVTSFIDQKRDTSVLEVAQEKLAYILGFTPEKLEDMKANIGGAVIDRVVTQAMMTSMKTTLEPKDIAFLANLQSQLKMDEDEFEQLVLDSRTKILRERVEHFIVKEHTAQSCNKIRQSIISSGIEFEKLGIELMHRQRMFAMEVGAIIEKGVWEESAEEIQELLDGYDLDEDMALAIMEDMVDRRFATLAEEAIRLVQTREMEEIAAQLDVIIEYGKVIPVEPESSSGLSNIDKSGLVKIYKDVLGSRVEDAEDAEAANAIREENHNRLEILLHMLGPYEEEEV